MPVAALTAAFVPSTGLDRSRHFYGEVLGLPVVGPDGSAVALDAGRLTIRVTYVGPEFTVQPFTVLGWESSTSGPTWSDSSSGA